MSEQEPEDDVTGISDDQLPDDLVPGEDNPLAEGLEDGESPGDLLHDGRPAEQDGETDGETGGGDGSDSGDDDRS